MHIVFLILKIIGIILLAVLGILMLLLLIVFFTPLKYKAEGSYHGGLRLMFRGSWLFHLLRFRAEYSPEEGLRWQAAIAWIKRSNEDEEKIEPETVLHAMETNHTDEVRIDAGSDDNNREKNSDHRTCSDEEKTEDVESGSIGRLKRIKYTFENICDKIKTVKDKKEEIERFLHDENNQAAFRKIWEQILYILKKSVPQKCSVKGILGFEEPAFTGEVFGGIAILYAWLGSGIELIPDFENDIIELDFLITGKFRLVYLLIAGMKLLVHRETRQFIFKMKNQFS